MEPIIKTLTLRRFRSFSDAEVQFDNPTFLIGPNGSGKSNLVDSLSFLQEAMDTQVGPALMRRGGFETVKHRAGGTIAFDQMGFGVALGKPHDEATAGRYAFVLRGSARGFVVDREQCVVDRQDGDRDWFEHSEDRFQSNVAGISPAVQSAALTLPVIGGDRRFEPVLRALSGIRKCAIEPSRLREWQGANGAGLRADGANAAAMLHTIQVESPEELERLCEILAAAVPGMKRVSSKEEGGKRTLEFLQDWGGPRVKFQADSMSDGTLRIVGMLLAVYQHPRPTVLMIEEPEATIHPGAISIVLDMLRHAARFMQVIVTTHSPDVLDAEWIEDRHLRMVEWSQGATQITPVSEGTRSALRDRLMTAGELLRSNALRSVPPSKDVSVPAGELFIEGP